MDTLALNLNSGTAATPLASVSTGLPQDEATTAIDFAALLSAGLDLAQENTGPGVVATTTHALSLPTERVATSELPTERVATSESSLETLPDITQSLAPTALPVTPERSALTPAVAPGEHSSNRMHTPAGQARQTPALAAAPAADLAAGAVHAAMPGSLAVNPGNAAPAIEPAFTAALSEQRMQERGAVPDHAVLPSVLPSIAHTFGAERPTGAAPIALLEVGAPVSGPGFADALSRQVVWMVDKDAQVAELRINPPELGPVEVRLKLSGEEATAQFFSAHAEVRSAIESALGRLREALAQAGIQLGEATVSAESFREPASGQDGHRESRHAYRAERDADTGAWHPEPARSRIPRGLIDVFA